MTTAVESDVASAMTAWWPVSRTPTPSGPVPIPYPNASFAPREADEESGPDNTVLVGVDAPAISVSDARAEDTLTFVFSEAFRSERPVSSIELFTSTPQPVAAWTFHNVFPEKIDLPNVPDGQGSSPSLPSLFRTLDSRDAQIDNLGPVSLEGTGEEFSGEYRVANLGHDIEANGYTVGGDIRWCYPALHDLCV